MSSNKGILLLLCIVGLLKLVQCQSSSNQPITGLIDPRKLFVERIKFGNYTGYYVELLNEISRIGQFNYTLKETSIPRSPLNQKPENLIHSFLERSPNRADFIIADYLFMGSNRFNEIEFTEPYQTAGLSIIIHKDRVKEYNIKSIDDLLEQRNRPRPTSVDGRQLDELAIGTVRTGNSYQQLSMSADKYLRKVYELIFPNPSNFVDSRENGIRRALSSPYAFIQESMNNELAIDEHCELVQFTIPTEEPSRGVIPFKYSVAMRRGSIYVEKFNKAIREMKENGKLESLKRRFWNRKCNGAESFNQLAKTILSISCIFLSMTISNFFLSLSA